MQLRLMEIGQVESWRIRRVPPDFTANALGVQGSGWSVLASDSLGQRLVLKQLYDQQGNLALATVPLLLLDM
jgi:superoxide dismutase